MWPRRLPDPIRRYYAYGATTTIDGVDIEWDVADSKGNTYHWSMPVVTYEDQIVESRYHVRDKKNLSLDGEKFWTVNLDGFVKKSFVNVIDDVYDNSHSNSDFIWEVWYIVSQLTVYDEDVHEYSEGRYALETLTRGGGDCEDLVILVADMLMSSSHTADWTFQYVWMDADNPTNPQTMNHVILYVADGEYYHYVEATAPPSWDYYPEEVIGWWADVVEYTDELDFSGQDLSGMDLEKRDFSGAILTGADLSGTDLSFADLSYADLSGANLQDADLYGAYLEGANLAYADLRNADLRRAYMGDVNLAGADLRDARLGWSNLFKADLTNTNLAGVDMWWADARNTTFAGADLSHSTMRGINLAYADFTLANLGNANLYGANLAFANLGPAYLVDAILTGTNLAFANLEGANLQNTQLGSASLVGANLQHAYLHNTNLYGADLSYANLRGANLHEAATIDKITLDGANLE